MQQKLVRLFKASEILDHCACMGILPISLFLLDTVSTLFNWNPALWVLFVLMVVMLLELTGAKMLVFTAMDIATNVDCDKISKDCQRMAIVLFVVSWLPMVVSFSMRSEFFAVVWFALTWILFGLAYVAELCLANVMLSMAERESETQNSER